MFAPINTNKRKSRSLVNTKDYGDVWNKYKHVWKGNKQSYYKCT